MFAGVVGVFLLAGEQPCRSESRHDQAETEHGFAMAVEVCGVGFAVATNVGASGIFRIGPPIVSLGVEVVWATGATLGVRRGYCNW